MEIQINNFKCYKKNNFIFHDLSITLLKGPSGKGKSTILEAIKWCLYGKIRKIESNIGSKSGRPNVTIKINIGGEKCEIYRQKKPNLLKFKVGVLEQVDDVAQKQIYGIFCNERIFDISCYHKQEEINPILRTKDSDKTICLNKLAFGETKPSKYISKIKELSKKDKILFEERDKIYNKEIEDFKSFRDSHDIKAENARNDEEMHDLVENKTKLEQDLVLKREKQKHHTQSSAAIVVLDKRIFEIKTKLETNRDLDILEKEILNIRNILKSLRNYKNFQEKLEDKSGEFTVIVKELEKYEEIEKVSPEFLGKSEILQSQYSLNLSRAKSIGIEYTKESIDHYKEFLRCLFKIQPLLEILKQMTGIREEMASLPTVNITEDEIKSQEEKVYDLKKGNKVLKCPNCSQNLLYKSDKLIECDHSPSTEEELSEAINILERMKEEYKISISKKNLLDKFNILNAEFMEEKNNITSHEKSIIGEYSKRVLNPKEKTDFDHKRSIVHSIEVLEIPEIDLEKLSKGVEKGKLLEKYDIISKSLESLKEKEPQFINCCQGYKPENILELEERFQDYNHFMKTKKELESELNKCENDKSKHLFNLNPGIDEEILEIEKELNSLRDLHEKAKFANEALRMQKHLIESKSVLEENRKKYINLKNLEEIAKDVQCKALQQTVDNLNSTINVLAENIFEDPISIELKLYKKIKSKKTFMPGVNIEIRYKGGIYESPNDMSGGEKNRLSLLLTLALNRISGSPILILDEVFHSLDEVTKEHCLRAIRSSTSGKTVICVDHNGVEGYYDHVIDIG